MADSTEIPDDDDENPISPDEEDPDEVEDDEDLDED
jgi:hypothetical protein